MLDTTYHQYPDKAVPKEVLLSEYFPMSSATLSRRLRVMRTSREFRNVEIRSAGKILINVRVDQYRIVIFLKKALIW